MVGAGAAAARRWSDCEKMLHVQEQMRSPKKMVGGAESRLESNPVPTRNAQKAPTKLVRTRDPTETEPELSEHLLRRCGSAGACCRGGAQVQQHVLRRCGSAGACRRGGAQVQQHVLRRCRSAGACPRGGGSGAADLGVAEASWRRSPSTPP